MTVGEIAGLLAAAAFLILVGVLAVPLVKLGRVLDAASDSLKDVTAHTLPVIDEAAATISTANGQLERIDIVTTAAAETTQNISALTSLVAATLGRPLIKAAAFSLAVRGFFARDRAR